MESLSLVLEVSGEGEVLRNGTMRTEVRNIYTHILPFTGRVAEDSLVGRA